MTMAARRAADPDDTLVALCALALRLERVDGVIVALIEALAMPDPPAPADAGDEL